MSDPEVNFPWREGNYQGEGLLEDILVTRDQGVPAAFPGLIMTFRTGDFGEADPEVAEASGEARYTVEMSYQMMGMENTTRCVLMEEGSKFCFKSSIKTMPVGFLQWVTPEEAVERAAKGDPIGAPPNHYTLEPERQGRLVWVTGAPGLGKSTTAQLLSKEHGFVYYEGDCFFRMRNPYIPSDVPEPSLAQLKQAKLVGEGAKERQELTTKVNNELMKMCAGEENDKEVMAEGYRALCADIRRERARLGGDWAVCRALFTRESRDIVRWVV